MWWSSMSTLQQVMFIIACAATAILVLQIILMLVGGAHDADFSSGGVDLSGGGVSDIDIGGASDVDVSTGGGILDVPDIDVPSGGITDAADADVTGGANDATNVSSGGVHFGLRLLSLRSIIAFCAIGGWMCYTLCYFLDWYWALIIALACGFGAACAMAAAIIGIEKLQDNGNIDPKNAIGTIGSVYLTVPPKRSGTGKINVLIQERYAEYEAITDSDESLKTSSAIKVVGYAGNNVLIVEKYKQPAITVVDDGK